MPRCSLLLRYPDPCDAVDRLHSRPGCYVGAVGDAVERDEGGSARDPCRGWRRGVGQRDERDGSADRGQRLHVAELRDASGGREAGFSRDLGLGCEYGDCDVVAGWGICLGCIRRRMGVRAGSCCIRIRTRMGFGMRWCLLTGYRGFSLGIPVNGRFVLFHSGARGKHGGE